MKGEYNEKIEYYEKALNEAHNSLRTYSTFIGFKGLNGELFSVCKKTKWFTAILLWHMDWPSQLKKKRYPLLMR